MSIMNMQATVSPGTGIVARDEGWVLAVMSDPTAPEVERLLSLVREVGAKQDPGRSLAHELARFMTELPLDDIPDFGLVADDSDGFVFTLHGPVVLQAATSDSEEEHSGEKTPTWVDGFIGGDAMTLSLGPKDGLDAPAFPTDLQSGVVPGGGISLRVEDAADAADAADAPAPADAPEKPAPAATPTEVEEEAPATEEEPEEDEVEEEEATEAPAFTTIDLSNLELPDSQPLPIVTSEESSGGTAVAVEPDVDEEELEVDEDEIVEGIRCIRHHFNHPNARFCAHCGVSMVQVTRQLVRDVRPPLGIIIFGDGDTFSLDSDYVIGRDPSIDDAVKQGAARPLTLEDPDQHLSRVHAEIRRDGWEVLIVDRQSANGTEMLRNGEWVRLESDTPERLAPGGQVRLGGYTFTFDSHHLARDA